ncbi:T-lymphocyte triggering factor [Angomonas deanei]|nr:T-lymphocyte triggering factor [Angomonas deanei]|eukprot:EPY24704.1 T-lymphocyte triggering factor [Angomonas deanei]
MPPRRRRQGGPVDPIQELKSMEEIHDVLEKAEQLRNYFKVERDKVNEMWNVSKQELEDARSKLLNVESEMEESERAHQVEMKVYKQKVRHLLYDHKVAVKQLKDESDIKLQEAEFNHQTRMNDIESDKAGVIRQIQDKNESQEGTIAEERDTHRYMITVTKKQNHEKELARLRNTYEAKLTSLKEDLELRRRAEVNDTEDSANEHINALIRQHEEKFDEMKAYYNNITKNNLEIIQSLKEEIAAMKRNDEQNENLMYDIEKENNSLALPLEQTEKAVAELLAKKKVYLQDKQRLFMTKTTLRKLREELSKLHAEHDELEEQYNQVFNEREELKSRFEVALRDAMNVVSERNADLQQSLIEANAKVEARDTQLDGVLRAMNLEPSALNIISSHIDGELEVKNQIIKDLYFELKKSEKKADAVLLEYERRCKAAEVPILSRENFNQTM